jgi:hypothetical protein
MPKSNKPPAKINPKARIITTAEAFEKKLKAEAYQKAVHDFCVNLQVQTGFEVVCEHRFHPKRLWRFDFAILELKVALEVQGGLFTNGRHSRGTGYINDIDKFNEAQLLGWSVYQCQPTELLTKGLDVIKRAIDAKKNS